MPRQTSVAEPSNDSRILVLIGTPPIDWSRTYSLRRVPSDVPLRMSTTGPVSGHEPHHFGAACGAKMAHRRSSRNGGYVRSGPRQVASRLPVGEGGVSLRTGTSGATRLPIRSTV